METRAILLNFPGLFNGDQTKGALCLPLQLSALSAVLSALCVKYSFNAEDAEDRRGSQRFAEVRRVESLSEEF